MKKVESEHIIDKRKTGITGVKENYRCVCVCVSARIS